MNSKRLTTSLLALTMGIAGFACTNLIVGKKASADGSVMITYSADDYGSYGYLHFYPAADHQPGDSRSLYDYETNNYLGEIPEIAHTYNVIGQINEHQLAIMETTFGGREELADSTGLLDYGSLMYVTLQRARTAREAIDVWTKLVETYGYRSEGESITLADPNEVWVLEMIGKGPGRKGAVWVARRLPDDCITGHANQARITRFPLKDPANCIYSKDVISFAREKGYFSGKDADFSFRDAYAPNDFSARRICEARVWTFFNRFCAGMDKYLPYAMGIEPLTFEVDGKKYFNERPISTQQTAVTYLAQLRSWMPNHVGGVLWVGFDDANMVAYAPVYCCSKFCPEPYAEKTADPFTFSAKSAYWLANALSNFVYPRYCQLFPELRDVRNQLDADFETLQQRTEADALKMTQSEAVSFLTDYTSRASGLMMDRWRQLFERIIVKYNDMAIKPEENGEYKKTAGGDHVPLIRTGYPERYRRTIIEQTGNHYLKP